MKELAKLRAFFLASVAAGIFLVGLNPATPARAQDKFTVVSWGGSFQETLRKAYFEPYSKDTGAVITEDTWGGETAKLRAMVESGNVTWDLMNGDFLHVIQGCDEGWLEPIDKSILGDSSDFVEGTLHECGIGTHLVSRLFAYNADNIPESWGDRRPSKIEDLFDTKAFPGKRAFRKRPAYLFEFALLADGVPPDKLYEVMSSPTGIDRILAKLDPIKDDIIFYKSNAQGPQLLADGEVSLILSSNGRVYNAIREGKNLVMVWDKSIYFTDVWFIPKGAKNKDAAMRFLEFFTQPEMLAVMNKTFPYAPTRVSSLQYVPDKIKPYLTTEPDNFKTAIYADQDWWAENEANAVQRFETWLAK